MLRPSQRASWIGYALIHHLLENYDTALTVLNEFRKGQGEVSTSYENSELILYQAMILLENKKHEEALKLLTDMSKEIVDVASLLETKGELFKTHLDSYLRHYLRKGAPPLFILLNELWQDPEKLSILDELLSSYKKNMASFHTFDGPQSLPEPPSTAIWLSYFIAQYLNFQKRHKEALDVVDDQLEKTPTLVDFYVLKADIYYSAGTLRAYVQTIRLEDRLRNHPSYFDIAKLAIEIYIHLHAQPLGADGSDADGDQSTLSTSEAKKLRNKQRKAARKAEAEAARVRAEQERREQAARSRQAGSEDNDPDRPAPADGGLDPNTLART
ncbi:N-alpha-acetyltransferase 15 NatA auxiliary subunit [Fasciolopsis buskii]|uniref:N-alpha-acetyltransferase 15 NatA auxiliary subunit n=1 Tax=Fasciolopsis buskii TaxID=27845 RepID=A0A8E0RJ61_9TREM|nr:N-alpha-acetyltransferase 15 NatA auxiliary subunit [Fasciolopsis buski]